MKLKYQNNDNQAIVKWKGLKKCNSYNLVK